MTKMRILVALTIVALIAAGCGLPVAGTQAVTKFWAVMIDGRKDEVQLTVQGHSTQTNSLIVAEKSDGTDVWTVSNVGVIYQAGNMTFEGATADDYETTLAITDPTADRTITLPNATGAVVLSTLTTNAPDAANSVTGASNALLFEGATANDHEGSLTCVDPTADRTWTIPDQTGYFLLFSNANTQDVNIVFEGATANDHETTLTVTDPTGDRTITLPDVSGTAHVNHTSQALTANTGTFSGDVTISPVTDGGNAGAKNEYYGLPRIKLVGVGTMANGTTNTVITDIGDSETPATDWTAIDADTVMSDDGTYYRQGTASLKMAIANTADATDGCTNALASGNQNWTDDESVGMWFYADTTLDAGDLQLVISDSAPKDSTADFPAYTTANVWVWIEINIGGIANGDKDVITDLSIELSAAGAARAALGAFNVYMDFIVKWDGAEEETLGVEIPYDGVLSLLVVDATDAGATTATLVEYTDYFVHYQSGNDAIVIISNQSDADKVGIALIAY